MESMTLVRSLSNHPYGGRMRVKGAEYEAAAEDVEFLIALKRVVPVLEADSCAYATRELQASVPPPAVSTRVRRRSAPANAPRADSSVPPFSDES